MQNNSLIKRNDKIFRILDFDNDYVFVIDCIKKTMPKWEMLAEFKDYSEVTEQELLRETEVILPDVEMLDIESKRFMHLHFTMIADILPFISDDRQRNAMIGKIAEEKNVSKQTIRHCLCLYLTYQNMAVLVPKQCKKADGLSKDEKNMRWALNKFFYTKNKNSLKVAYTMMLKEKYCDSLGELLPPYPTFYQFRYFYRKNKSMQTYYISRDGLKNYQRNNRPLIGDGVQEFAHAVGVGMLDATICDIYLVNESGNLVGRPILTACIDAYSSLCCGYALSWEGGVYSLRGLMLNVIADKVEWCKQFGISIQREVWNCNSLPATLVTDMGSEYASENFEQIAELGVSLINLPAYRPELKGSVEKFFDLIQNSFKPYLKGKGVIEPDYRERGAHDYRKDACLTMAQFEKIILHCIIYYNSGRIIENYPLTESMIQAEIQPYANEIWNWGIIQSGANLISVDDEQLILSLLPRVQGKFSRFGLRVNGLRYKNENYTEKYLSGGVVNTAYNPDDISYIWLIENGAYIRFELIESRFKGKCLAEVQTMQDGQKSLVKGAVEANLQARIHLANHIETIINSAASSGNVDIKGIRDTRQKERNKRHIDFMKGGAVNE